MGMGHWAKSPWEGAVTWSLSRKLSLTQDLEEDAPLSDKGEGSPTSVHNRLRVHSQMRPGIILEPPSPGPGVGNARVQQAAGWQGRERGASSHSLGSPHSQSGGVTYVGRGRDGLLPGPHLGSQLRDEGGRPPGAALLLTRAALCPSSLARPPGMGWEQPGGLGAARGTQSTSVLPGSLGNGESPEQSGAALHMECLSLNHHVRTRCQPEGGWGWGEWLPGLALSLGGAEAEGPSRRRELSPRIRDGGASRRASRTTAGGPLGVAGGGARCAHPPTRTRGPWQEARAAEDAARLEAGRGRLGEYHRQRQHRHGGLVAPRQRGLAGASGPVPE